MWPAGTLSYFSRRLVRVAECTSCEFSRHTGEQRSDREWALVHNGTIRRTVLGPAFEEVGIGR
jgi:hypothetical protein